MAEGVVELNSENFDKLTEKGKWAVDFWAGWCGPCIMLKPVFEAVAKEMQGKVKFGKVDIDSEQELAERFGVMSIPTIVLIQDGEIVETSTGYVSKDVLHRRVSEALLQ